MTKNTKLLTVPKINSCMTLSVVQIRVNKELRDYHIRRRVW